MSRRIYTTPVWTTSVTPGSDYPHAESTWPRSQEILERILVDIPDDEKAKIAGANVARLYQLN